MDGKGNSNGLTVTVILKNYILYINKNRKKNILLWRTPKSKSEKVSQQVNVQSVSRIMRRNQPMPRNP